jgi:glycosyltransferase involved in cell wall biosynthesis
MKIMYLTWGETPRSYGVFGSQVIGQFVETKRQLPEHDFLLVSAVPLINSGLVRERLSYLKELKKVKEALGDIAFLWIPILSTQNFIYTSKWFFKWIFFGALGTLRATIQKFNPDIIHCRSYLAAWAALYVKKKFDLSYKIVFDARGLYPEELALKKGYSDKDSTYLFLKEVEILLLGECDTTVAVSDTMADHFNKLEAKSVETIYLSASFNKLSLIESPNKNNLRPLNFCYVGALSEGTWHQPSSLFDLFSRLKELFPDSTLTIVTKSDHEVIRKIFASFLSGDVRIGSSNSLEELKGYLGAADFGLMSYFVPSSSREMMLADMVMAVKTAEYLCAGLPMIVNQYCGGASRVVEKYGLGLTYDPKNLKSLSSEKIWALHRKKIDASNISEQAKSLFDYESNAIKYANLYRKLSPSNN